MKTREVAREWADHVTGEFDTAFGKLRFAVTSADHVHIEGPKATEPGVYNVASVLINRVAYHLSAHLHRKPDGTWDVKDIRDVYLSRPDSAKAFDYSLAAVQKARSVLSAAWTKYAAEHPEIFRPAQLGHINNDVIRLDEEIAEAEKKLGDLKAKRAALLSEEVTLEGKRS